jgi:CheY-like chemotaxis protein
MRTQQARTTILLVDDNRDLLHFLERLMSESGWELLTAETAGAARKIVARKKPNAALIDYMLSDVNGVELALQLREAIPKLQIIMMTGAILPPEEEAICQEHDFPVLRKPFLASHVMNQFRSRLGLSSREKKAGRTRKKVSQPGTAGEGALKVFFCYSHRDEQMRDRLDAHLSTLKHMWIVQTWHDRKISVGEEWDKSIDRYLKTADLILLLISPDFLRSEYCYRKEMAHALERHNKGDARVIPVILRPVDWENAPFSILQALPTDGKPITRFSNRDEGYLAAARGIRKAAEELSASIVRPGVGSP